MFAILEGTETALDVGPVELALSAAFYLVIGLVAVWAYRRLESRVLAPARQPRGTFLMIDLGFLVLLFFVSMYVSLGLLGIELDPEALDAPAVEAPMADEEPEDFVGMLLAQSAVFAVMSAYVFLVAWRRRGGFATLGVSKLTSQRIPLGRGLSAIGTYVAAAPFLVIGGVALTLWYAAQGQDVPDQDVAVGIAEHISTAPVLIPVIAVLVIPFLEEVLFRGFLLELFRPVMGAWPAIAASAACFALLHGAAAAVVIFPLAMALGYCKLRTRSLLAPCLIHSIHNGIMVTATQFSDRLVP